MTGSEINHLIEIACGRDFDHCSKTYWRGLFLNIAGPNGRLYVNLTGNYSACYQGLQKLKK